MTKPDTNLEIERGRLIAGRAQRQSDLNRLIEGKKVKVMVAIDGHPLYDRPGALQTNIFYVDGVDIGHEDAFAIEYPSEPLMAKILLAVNATVGMEGIPSAETIDPEVRRQRNEYRKNSVINWGGIS